MDWYSRCGAEDGRLQDEEDRKKADAPQPAMITDATDALEFILAGRAKFTLRSKASGVRYTYKVSKPNGEETPMRFVSLLTGADNEASYTYLGMIDRQGAFRLTKKSSMTPDSPPVKAFAWTHAHLTAGNVPDALELWHEGTCGRCGRTLTVPESIASGFGPECSKRRGNT